MREGRAKYAEVPYHAHPRVTPPPLPSVNKFLSVVPDFSGNLNLVSLDLSLNAHDDRASHLGFSGTLYTDQFPSSLRNVNLERNRCVEEFSAGPSLSTSHSPTLPPRPSVSKVRSPPPSATRRLNKLTSGEKSVQSRSAPPPN